MPRLSERPQSGGGLGELIASILGFGLIIYIARNQEVLCWLTPWLTACG